jgi:SAM-dependent methyltransferase
MSAIKHIWNVFSDYLGKTPVHPQYFLKKYEYGAVLVLRKKAKGILVDIGCGRQIYKKDLVDKVEKYIGVDHPSVSKKYEDKEMPDVLADALDLPFKDRFCDTVSMISVLEHIPEPLEAIKEAYRILKPNGVFILVTVQNYPLHDAPYDFFRYTRFSLKNLLIQAGFKKVNISPLGNFPVFWGQMLNVFLLNLLKKGAGGGLIQKTIFVLLILPVFAVCILSNLLSILFSNYEDYNKGAFAIYNMAIAIKTPTK